MHKVIILGFPLLFLFVVDSFQFERTITGVCQQVYDGDTIKVQGVVIRLKGIDAPEKAQLSLDKIPIGSLSTTYLSKLILGKPIQVKYTEKGRYGRIIGEVFLGSESINQKMVRAGWALVYHRNKDVHLHAFEHIAKLKRKGIFETLGFYRPNYFRKLNPYKRESK